MSQLSEYKATYTTFGGADIVAIVHDKVVGELQGISYSVTREKVPVYTMGSADPRSFSRGKRGIAGSMVFTVFNKDVFSDFDAPGNEEITTIWTASGNKTTSDSNGVNIISLEDWEAATSEGNLFSPKKYNYADEIFPFDVTITLHNEYGQAAKFSILACEILNEGMGMSIDDVSTEKACTFVARGVSKLVPVTTGNSTVVSGDKQFTIK